MTEIVTRRLAEKPGAGRLGRHVEHDPRSRRHSAVGKAEAKSRARVLRRVLHIRRGGPFDQSKPFDLGSCTGNALAGLLNTDPFVGKRALLVEADAVRLYSSATHLDRFRGFYPPTDTGSSGLAVCKAAKAEGLISAYKHAFSLDAALVALQDRPVITGVPWLDAMDHPDADGHVEISGASRGGHEFEVVGFEPASTNEPLLDGIVAAWQSWGAWGKGGMFYFTARGWGDLLARKGDVTVPIP